MLQWIQNIHIAPIGRLPMFASIRIRFLPKFGVVPVMCSDEFGQLADGPLEAWDGLCKRIANGGAKTCSHFESICASCTTNMAEESMAEESSWAILTGGCSWCVGRGSWLWQCMKKYFRHRVTMTVFTDDATHSRIPSWILEVNTLLAQANDSNTKFRSQWSKVWIFVACKLEQDVLAWQLTFAFVMLYFVGFTLNLRDGCGALKHARRVEPTKCPGLFGGFRKLLGASGGFSGPKFEF